MCDATSSWKIYDPLNSMACFDIIFLAIPKYEYIICRKDMDKKLFAKKVKNRQRELGMWSLEWQGIKYDAETLYSKSLSLQVFNGVMGFINSKF